MPAYNRGDLSIEAYLVRVIAAICKQAGGEIRVKGELVDMVGEPTALMKSWDTSKQELVLSVSMGSYSEVYRVTPEKQNSKQAVLFDSSSRPADTAPTEPQPTARNAQTLDDDKVANLERKLKKVQLAREIKREIAFSTRGENHGQQ